MHHALSFTTFLPVDSSLYSRHLQMVASTGETDEQMGLQLTYVFNQIIFVLTQSQLTRIFQQRINYDLRRVSTSR